MTSADQLFEELDRQWSEGVEPRLIDFLGQLPEEENDLRVELCALDLEWRWRQNRSPRPGDDRSERFPPQPRAIDYRPLIARQWKDPIARRNLLEAEWCARSLWGDQPDVDEFASQLPDREWSLSLAKQLDALMPMDATITVRPARESLRLHVHHDFVIGRQRVGEPSAPAWLEASRRLIVAGNATREFSREHFHVRRTSSRAIEITNLSSNDAEYERRRLLPRESMRVELPFWLEAGGVQVSLELRTDGVESEHGL